MRISIFGLGYVGSVTSACLARHGHHVIGVDPDSHKRELLEAGRAPVIEPGLDDLIHSMVQDGMMKITDNCVNAVALSEVSLVCVGTPTSPSGRMDFTALQRVAEQIGEAIRAKGAYHLVVIRSTVLPGTTMNGLVQILEKASGGKLDVDFGIAYNPEFLREGSSLDDFEDPPFTVIGTTSERSFGMMEQVYEQLEAETLRVPIEVAEMVKAACNMYHAVKITFANEIGMLCKPLDIDARQVMDVLRRDTKLNASGAYLKPGFAYGGSCLPKDLRAMTRTARRHDVTLPMLEAVQQSNSEQIESVARRVLDSGKRKVTMLGLSFKPKTDDLRESPYVRLAEILFGRGLDLRVFDPNVEYAALHGSNRRAIERDLPHLKQSLVSAEEAIEHAELVIVAHRTPETLQAMTLINAEQPPMVVDLAGLPAPDSGTSLKPRQTEGLYW